MDGACLPHWDEALDESTGIIEAVHFAPYLYGGQSLPCNYSAKYAAPIIPVVALSLVLATRMCDLEPWSNTKKGTDKGYHQAFISHWDNWDDSSQ